MPAAISAVPARSGRSGLAIRVSGTRTRETTRTAIGDRHVDQEDHPPAGAEQVRRRERAAGDQADRRGQAADRAVHREGLAPLLRREDHPEGREHLRRDGGRGRALEHPEGDELTRSLGQRAGQAGEAEGRRADQEELAPAEAVAELAGRDQARGEGQQVARDDPGQLVARGVQVTLDRGQGDVDDRAVEQVHQGRDHHHRGDQPSAGVEVD